MRLIKLLRDLLNTRKPRHQCYMELARPAKPNRTTCKLEDYDKATESN